MEAEWSEWKGKPKGGRPLAVKWESVYVSQTYYEDIKDLMIESASP